MSWQREIGEALISGPFGDLIMLIPYGSRKANADRDYLAVFDEPQSTGFVMLGHLDLWATDIESFNHHLELLDPFVTEPLLTGTLVFGEQALLDSALERLEGTSPNTETATYLLRRAMEAWGRAYEVRDRSGKQAARWFWSTLSFSISYWSFAREYSWHWERPLTLTLLQERMPGDVRELFTTTRQRKEALAEIDRQVLDRWSNWIIRP